jgi:hypothetical protein
MTRKDNVRRAQARNAGGDPTAVASRLDKLFFEQHPDDTERIRPLIPGEFGAAVPPPGTEVWVTKISPDIRTRNGIIFFGADGQDAA